MTSNAKLFAKIKWPILFVSLAPILTILFSLQLRAANNWSGHYCGELFNSQKMVSAFTNLVQNVDGSWDGEYFFLEGGQKTFGKLSKGRVIDDSKLVLSWSDKYGKGHLEIKLNETATEFHGLWGINDDLVYLPWNGIRCDEPVS